MARTIRRLFLLGLLFALLPSDYVAGRTALSYYCGYVFRPVREAALDTTGGYNRAVVSVVKPQSAKVVGTVRLYPNPTPRGAVQVDFEQAAGRTGRLVVYDAYGLQMQELTLLGERGTVTLATDGLRPGLYYYTQWVGQQKGQRGTLIVQP